jgi:membrane-bound hydrogenase subunit mbhJ
MNPFAWLLAISRRKSPWIYCTSAGSCNGCDIELGPCLTPRYDAEQLGVLRQGSPKHADILLITGPVTLRSRDALISVYEQMPGPKAVVALGSCPAGGNVYARSPTIDGPVSKFIPVDVWVPGCPPRPQQILVGIAQAADLLARGLTADQKRQVTS